MVDAPAAVEAAALAREQPALGVGLHVDLTHLTDAALHDDGAVAREVQRQLDAFRALVGNPPTHVDSHHHLHLSRLGAFRRVTDPAGLPLRGDGRAILLRSFYAASDRGSSDLDRVSPERFEEMIATLGDGWFELMCHPGRVTSELASSYRLEREAELAALTHPRVRTALDGGGTLLATFADLPARPAP